VRVRRLRAERKQGLSNPVHVPHGAWLVLCHSCDDRKRHQENAEYCKLTGLDTPAVQRAWCLEQLKRGILGRDRELMREPGSDDE